MVIDLTYGALEGWPAIWNDMDAWWRPNGKWFRLHPAEAWAGAHKLTKADFDKRFPGAQRDLPATSFQPASP